MALDDIVTGLVELAVFRPVRLHCRNVKDGFILFIFVSKTEMAPSWLFLDEIEGITEGLDIPSSDVRRYCVNILVSLLSVYFYHSDFSMHSVS